MSESVSAKTIFLTAIEKPIAEQAGYLHEACGDNHDLRDEVERLIAVHRDGDSFLERPAELEPTSVSGVGSRNAIEDGDRITEGPGSVIGRYKLLEQLGEGGMGVVYMAEQTEPVRRKIALKIIKPGMDSRQVIARFEAERQALAMMDHQNIARVLDAGTTETGRPYFVMELVKGIPITDYSDRNRLTLRERLELFVPICQAIQHAHQKGIIHRDIKPSNVMITLYDGKPVPKVIDFGVAKAVEQPLTNQTMFTRYGQILGTLEYMSPEQAEMSALDVDIRSDIYSLGVLLYELLTGSTPITAAELREAGLTEMLRVIREKEPDRPSLRLSQSGDALAGISAQRRAEPKKLSLVMRGELDWIVMKALEKDRTRRYDSASAFAADVRRHLSDEAVEACPPSVGYRLEKFARRNKRWIVTALVVTGVMVMATTVSVWQAYRATMAERVLLAMDRERSNLLQQATNDRNRAVAAENQAREQLQEATKQTLRAEQAEKTAKSDRDRAVEAEKSATKQRERAEEVTVDALHTLGQSAFHNARAILATNQPGRRWAALDAIKMANSLQTFDKQDLPGRGKSSESLEGMTEALGMGAFMSEAERVTGAKPTTAQLRSEAVAALLQPDGRVAIKEWRKEGLEKHPVPMQWDGITHAVSPDGKFAISFWIDPDKDTGGHRVIHLATGKTGKELQRKQTASQGIGGTVVALGPAGRLVAMGSLDFRTIRIRDLIAGRQICELKAPPPKAENQPDSGSPTTGSELMQELIQKGADAYKATKDEQATPDGRRSRPNKSRTFDIRSYGLIREISFSPNGKYLAALRLVGMNTECLVWEVEAGAEPHIVVSAPRLPQARVAFSPDGRLLAVPAGGQRILLWNLAESREERSIELPADSAGSLTFSPDGNTLFAGCLTRTDLPSATGMVIAWDVDDEQELARIGSGISIPAGPMSCSDNGRRLAVSDMAGTIRAFQVGRIADHGNPSNELLRIDHGAAPQVIAWSEDSSRLVSANMGSLKIWEFAEPAALSLLQLETDQDAGPISRIMMSPDGRLVATEQQANKPKLAVFDRQTGRLVRELPLDQQGQLGTLRFIFSADSRQIIGQRLAAVDVFDVATGERTLSQQSSVFGLQRTGLTLGVRDDETILIGGMNGQKPSVWNAKNGDMLWQGKSDAGTFAVVSLDGTVAVTCPTFPGSRSSPIVIDLVTGQSRFELQSNLIGEGQHRLVDICPRSRRIVSFYFRQPSAAGIQPVAEFLEGTRRVEPFGASDSDWNGQVWNAETGSLELGFAGPSNVEDYAFSPDGNFLAVSLRNGQVQLFDLAGRQGELFRWQAWPAKTYGGPSPRDVAFTAEGTAVVVPSVDGPWLRVLDLKKLNEELAEFGISW